MGMAYGISTLKEHLNFHSGHLLLKEDPDTQKRRKKASAVHVSVPVCSADAEFLFRVKNC